MKNIFVDTNIIIDLLSDRKPHSKFAVALFEKAESKKVKLFVSSLSFATTHYVLKKYVNEKDLRAILSDLLDFVHVIPIDSHMIKRGLISKHADFEDALQIVAALSVDKMDCIVTRDLKHYKDSDIPVFSPDSVLKKL